jgi:serine acetyltransferase
VIEPLTGHRVLGAPKEGGHYNTLELFLDYRGGLKIHKSSVWGFRASVLTQCHYPNARGTVVNRPVTVCKDAFIGSFAVLYNCYISEGAMVSVGTVVRSKIVRPFTMVEGNPAREIAEWDFINDKWTVHKEPRELRHIKFLE